MPNTPYDHQRSQLEDQRLSTTDPTSEMGSSEDASLHEDGSLSIPEKIEDLTDLDAITDEYHRTYAERFLQEANCIYEEFTAHKDWLKFAIDLWHAMRSFYGKSPDLDAPASLGKHLNQKKYQAGQLKAYTLVSCFMKEALTLLDNEMPETAQAYVIELLDRVQDEYAVAHSVSMGTGSMNYMYEQFIYFLKKKIQLYHEPAMTHLPPSHTAEGDDREGRKSLEEFAYQAFKALDPETQNKLRACKTKNAELTEIKYSILEEYLDVPRELFSGDQYRASRAAISRAVMRLRRENG